MTFFLMPPLKSLQEELNSSIQKENKREALKITGKYIIEHVDIPITIVECGFLSNKQDLEKLKSDDYQSQMAFAICVGILNFMEG